MTKAMQVTIGSLALAAFVGAMIGFFVAFSIFHTPEPTERVYTQTEVDEMLEPVLQYEDALEACENEKELLQKKITDIMTILVPTEPIEHTGVDVIGVEDGTSD